MPSLHSPVWQAHNGASTLCSLCSPAVAAPANNRVRKAASEAPAARPSKRGRGSFNEPFILDDENMDDENNSIVALDPNRFLTPNPEEWILVKRWYEQLDISSGAFSNCSHAESLVSIPLTVASTTESRTLKLVSSDGTVIATRQDSTIDVSWLSLQATKGHQRMGTLFTTLDQLEGVACRVQAFIQLPDLLEDTTATTKARQLASVLFRVCLQRSFLTAVNSVNYFAVVDHRLQDLLHFLFPPQHLGRYTDDAIRDLYTHIRAPPTSSQEPNPAVQPKDLLPTLLPFQRRSVAWMLSREGVPVINQEHSSSATGISPQQYNHLQTLPVDWELERGGGEDGSQAFLIHRLLGRICLIDMTTINRGEAFQRRECSGGILAEEMGLGKTVETMALILLHQRPQAETKGMQLKDEYASDDREASDLVKSFSSSHLYDNTNSAPPMVDLTAQGGNGESSTRATFTPALIQSKATLIITPPSILYQWQSELASHAPSLSVFVYQGHEGMTAEELASYDVVLATYNALGQDIHVARYQERVYRHKRQYTPRKSLFVQIHWWRICLDEAQLVEVSTSKAAEMANMLVRTHSWAISGTPVKKQSEDLHGLLLFLGVEPYSSNKKLWKLVVHRCFRPLFLRCFQRIMRRHAKKDVEQELRIPPQRSLAHRIEFTDVEHTNYFELWDQFLREVSWQTVQDGSADMETLRVWLLRFRQTCCHPQIGSKNAQVLGGSGELRTITQVLDSMLYQAMSNLNVQERTLVTMKMNRAILHARINKSIDVVPAFNTVYNEIRRQIEKWSKMVIEARSRIKTIKRAARVLGYSTVGSDDADSDDNGDDTDEGNLLGNDEGDGGSTSLVRTGRSANTLEGQLALKRAVLRHWMEQEHRVLFFLAGVYHDLEMGQEETQHYEMAEKVRLQLLRNAEHQFVRRKAKIEIEVGKIEMANLSSKFEIPESEVGAGIVLQSVVERLDELTNILNRQLQMMQGWREDLVKRLLQPLMQDGEEGEQYQYSIELQHTLEAYLHYYGRMLLLRKDLLSGTADAITTHKNLLKSKREQAEMVARREMRAAANSVVISASSQLRQQQKRTDGKQDKQGEEVTATAAEKQVDKVELLDKQLEADLDSIICPELEQSLRAFRNEIRSLPMRRDMPEIEKKMCDLEAQRLSQQVERQMELCQALEAETVLFRMLTSDRTRYYRQLQQISDMVRDVQSMDPEADIQASLESEAGVSATITQMTSKLRYLENLAATNQQQQQPQLQQFDQDSVGTNGQEANKIKSTEDDAWCLVCRGGSEFGTLTACGHVFCEECIKAWIAVRAVCPTCMAPIVKRHLTRVYMGSPKAASSTHIKDTRASAGEGGTSGSGSDNNNVAATSRRDAASTLASNIYGEIQQLPEAINAMPIRTGYGSKIDSISRHIAYLIKENPSVKCIVFSQWQTLLDILGASLDTNRIGYIKMSGSRSSVKDGRGKAVQQFKDDPDKHVFMLHAKTQSAGLTLLAATHVFICEPLVNPVLQAQAVNRVHRIGQTQETYVHYYLVQDTIEMPVYDLFEQKMAARSGASNQRHQEQALSSEDNQNHDGSPGEPLAMDVDQVDQEKDKSKARDKGKARAMPIEINDEVLPLAQDYTSTSIHSTVGEWDAEDETHTLKAPTTEPDLTANAAKEVQDRSGELVNGEDVLYCFRAAKAAADLALRVHDMGMSA